MTVNLGTLLMFSPWVKFYPRDGIIILGHSIGIHCNTQIVLTLRRLRIIWNESLSNGHDGEENVKLAFLKIVKSICEESFYSHNNT